MSNEARKMKSINVEFISAQLIVRDKFSSLFLVD